MLHEKRISIKLLILFSACSLTGILKYYLLVFTFSENNLLIGAGYLFVILWIHIFWGFMFFQLFKYFRFPKNYYEKRKFETPQYFNMLGVKRFRKVIINSFFKYLNQRVYLKGRTRGYVKVFIQETMQSETSHVFAFSLSFMIVLALLFTSRFGLAIVLLIMDVIFNLYPVLLQRMNRFEIKERLHIG